MDSKKVQVRRERTSRGVAPILPNPGTRAFVANSTSPGRRLCQNHQTGPDPSPGPDRIVPKQDILAW
jgi:hypothetical protein